MSVIFTAFLPEDKKRFSIIKDALTRILKNAYYNTFQMHCLEQSYRRKADDADTDQHSCQL